MNRARREYFKRKLETGEVVKGFPLLYPVNERPPPVDTIVNGYRTPTFMFCWNFVWEDLCRKYNHPRVSEIRSQFALPRWKEKYADQFGVEMLPRMRMCGPYLLLFFGINQSEEYMDSITRPELIAAAKEVYDIPDDLDAGYELKWRRIDL
ncbi:hypothetical protein BDZ89DRAFT_1079132 [Hymenopellis radicata]|nr:hypothetical protein BDZ89DRAFT_1079132 [Hymenopellis radicata]